MASRTWIKVLRVIAWFWVVTGPASALIGIVLLIRFERTGLGAKVPLANV